MPGGRALIRLQVVGGADWDARITGRRVRIISARDTGEPDALISADPATWLAVGASVRGGLRAFGAGRLRIRGSLHLGIGFLAATSGSTERGRLVVRDAAHRRGFGVDPLGRDGAADVAVPPWPRRDQGVVPADRCGAVGRLSRGGHGPAGLRRVRQADRRALRRRLVRALGLRNARRAGRQARLGRRQQHGRAGGDRGGPDGPRPGARHGPAEPRPRLAARPPLGGVGAAAPPRARPRCRWRRARWWRERCAG